MEEGLAVEDAAAMGGGQDDDAGGDERGRPRTPLLEAPGDPADERQHDEKKAVLGA